jgi:Flp pilus assembly protein TadG
MKKVFTNKNTIVRKAQAMVEFAIALPILLMVLIGIFEVGRMVFVYSSVTNASRNASRYASAVGMTLALDNINYYHKYVYCDGIKDIVYQTAYMVPDSSLTITISYDDGNGNALAVCDAAGGEDADALAVPVGTGDRVTVTVSAPYKPIVRLVPIKPRTITATSSRTILGIIKLD